MKKLLFIAFIVAFTGVVSAQDRPKAESDIAQKQKYLERQSKSLYVNSDVEKQTKQLLTSNDELGEEAISYLKTDAKSVNSLKKIYKENNGVVNDIMKAVMKDPMLSQTVMDWAINDPKAKELVAKLMGM